MLDKSKTYIYALIDPVTNDVRYVGKSNSPFWRFKRGHLKDEANTHKANWIRSLKNKGLNPIFQIIEVCEKTIWQEREKDWVAFYRKLGCNLTNATDGGEGTEGYVVSEETKKKISIGNKNPSEDRRRKISEASRNRKPSEEVKKQISNTLKGRKLSEEVKKKISDTLKGRKPSLETLEKRSKALKGKNTWTKGRPSPMKGKRHTEESRKKMSEASKMQVFTQKTRNKISIANKGQKRTKEQKKRMSEAQKLRWMKQKDRKW